MAETGEHEEQRSSLGQLTKDVIDLIPRGTHYRYSRDIDSRQLLGWYKTLEPYAARYEDIKAMIKSPDEQPIDFNDLHYAYHNIGCAVDNLMQRRIISRDQELQKIDTDMRNKMEEMKNNLTSEDREIYLQPNEIT